MEDMGLGYQKVGGLDWLWLWLRDVLASPEGMLVW